VHGGESLGLQWGGADGEWDEWDNSMRVEKVVMRLTAELYEDLRKTEAVGNSQRDAKASQRRDVRRWESV